MEALHHLGPKQKHQYLHVSAEQLPLHLVSHLQLQQDLENKLFSCPCSCLATCNAGNNLRE